MKSIKTILRTPSALVILLASIVTLIGVIITNEYNQNIAFIPIKATMTAEARLTESVHFPTLTQNSVSITPTYSTTISGTSSVTTMVSPTSTTLIPVETSSSSVLPTSDVATLTPFPSIPLFATNTQDVESYFEINVNGDHRIYKGDGFVFSFGKWTAKLRNSGNATDSFELQFPPDIQSGTTFNIVGDAFGTLTDEYVIIYTTISGWDLYSFGLMTGEYYKINIETWDEKNGIAVGEISGERHPSDATPLIFSGGKFIISINITNY